MKKITELKGYKGDPAYHKLKQVPRDLTMASYDFSEFIEEAENRGWVLKGTGVFGTVLYKPGKAYVYKVHKDPEQTYIDYVNWAREHQNNPFVPKVGKVLPIPGTKANFMNKIELLTPLDGKNDPKLKKYIDPKIMDVMAYQLDDENPWWRHRDMPVHPNCSSLINASKICLYETDSQFREVIDYVRKYAELDVHHRNVMWRGDQLVITDPVSWRKPAA